MKPARDHAEGETESAALNLLAIAGEFIARFFLRLVLRPLISLTPQHSQRHCRKLVERFLRCEAMVTRAIHVAARRLAGLPAQYLPLSAYRLEQPRTLEGYSIRFRQFHRRMTCQRACAIRLATKIRRAAKLATSPTGRIPGTGSVVVDTDRTRALESNAIQLTPTLGASARQRAPPPRLEIRKSQPRSHACEVASVYA